jgi:hypothetical protein
MIPYHAHAFSSMNDRRKQSARSWGVLVVVVLIAYPVSMGPAFWLCTDEIGRIHSDWRGDFFWAAYDPLIGAYQKGPKPVRAVLGWYLELWGMP